MKTPDFLEFQLAAFATWQAVEIWHHGEIFARQRARLETWLSLDGLGLFQPWLASMMLCPFCLSVWVGFLAAALLVWFPYPLWILAISRMANLANDLAWTVTRTTGPRAMAAPNIFSEGQTTDEPWLGTKPPHPGKPAA